MVAVEAVNIVSLPGDAEINEQLVFSDAICRDGFCLVSGDARQSAFLREIPPSGAAESFNHLLDQSLSGEWLADQLNRSRSESPRQLDRGMLVAGYQQDFQTRLPAE